MLLKFFLLLFTLLSLSLIGSFAQPYYADITIDVDEKGKTSVTGLSTIPSIQTPLVTDEYTSKKGSYWTLNITSEEEINSFVFEVILPKGATINYLKTTPSFRLEDESGRLKIIGSGNNRPLEIIVQYSIDSQNQNPPYLFLFGIFVLLGIFFGTIINWIFFRRRNKNNKKKEISKNSVFREDEKEKIDLTFLTPRQQDIMTILLKEKKITQKELEERIHIPKSSISRNLKTLQIKGYIHKEHVGTTNYIVLKN